MASFKLLEDKVKLNLSQGVENRRKVVEGGTNPTCEGSQLDSSEYLRSEDLVYLAKHPFTVYL